ncbi:MAG: hypothetical protein ACE5GB_09090, partial [Acidimicrobiales bacterium]
AVVPDTEAAVIAVGVVLSRLVVSGRPAEPIDPLDAAGLAALTQVAAVLGSVGRTSTFAPAAVLASGSLAAVVLVPVAVKGARSVSGRVHPHTSSEP